MQLRLLKKCATEISESRRASLILILVDRDSPMLRLLDYLGMLDHLASRDPGRRVVRSPRRRRLAAKRQALRFYGEWAPSLGLQFPTQTVDWDGTPSEFLKLHTSIRDCV